MLPPKTGLSRSAALHLPIPPLFRSPLVIAERQPGMRRLAYQLTIPQLVYAKSALLLVAYHSWKTVPWMPQLATYFLPFSHSRTHLILAKMNRNGGRINFPN